jgi:hypothetical protein
MSDMEAIETSPMAEEPKVEVLLQDVQIFTDHVKVILNGGVEKAISLNDFRNILNSVIGIHEDQKLEGFNLPSNVFYFAKSGNEIQLSCYYQARKAVIQYYDKKMPIVMPNVIISHVLERTGEKIWRVRSSKYFCTDFSVSRLPRDFINRLDHSNHIFLLPMSNTYDNGNMCYGGNQMISRFSENNLRGLDWYYQYMFESPFNDDLGVYAIRRSMPPKEWYALLSELAKEDKPFPYEKLTGYSPA